jgi:hypothetical protein
LANAANTSQGLTIDLDMLGELARADADLEREIRQLVA